MKRQYTGQWKCLKRYNVSDVSSGVFGNNMLHYLQQTSVIPGEFLLNSNELCCSEVGFLWKHAVLLQSLTKSQLGRKSFISHNAEGIE